jgi:hypothetical protein
VSFGPNGEPILGPNGDSLGASIAKSILNKVEEVLGVSKEGGADGEHMPPGTNRHFTDQELTALTGVDADGNVVGRSYTRLNRDQLMRVVIMSADNNAANPIFAKIGRYANANSAAVTPDAYRIIFPAAGAEYDFTTRKNFDWLVHETFHTYQNYHSIIPLPVWAAGHEQPRDYKYTLDATPFSKYGVEQQATMVGDLYRREHGLLASPYGSTNPTVSAAALREKIFGH